MDQLTRRRTAFAAIIALMILGSIFYFFWGNFLNHGRIVLTGNAPFSVNIYESGEFICDKSPCEIEQKIGTKNLILQKEGKENLILEVDVPLWRSTIHAIKFKTIPYLKEVTEIPASDAIQQFELKYDDNNKYYKLVDATSTSESANAKDVVSKEPIAFFQKEIKSPIIYGNNKSVLVIDGETFEAYKVDRSKNTREKINEDFSGITKGLWSNNGNAFVFETKNGRNLKILIGENNLHELNLNKDLSVYTPADNGELFFATSQTLAPSTQTGLYSNYVTVVEELSTEFSFGIYHPDENSYTEIEGSDLQNLPTELVPASNGKIIYFQYGEKKYALYFD